MANGEMGGKRHHDPHNGGGTTKHSQATWSDAPAMAQEHGDSAPQHTSVGGGSRPTNSKMPIRTSASTDAHTLERAPSGWLK